VSRNQTSAFGGQGGFWDNGRMIIGYARVSTADQRLDLQVDALTKAGCDRIFTDHASGGRGDRVGMTDALSHLRAGDTLMVWKLDRLGRSVRELVEFTAQLEKRGIQFASLTDGIDTGSSAGRSSSTSWRRWPRWSGTWFASGP